MLDEDEGAITAHVKTISLSTVFILTGIASFSLSCQNVKDDANTSKTKKSGKSATERSEDLLRQGRKAKDSGELVAAITHFRKAVKVDPKNAFAWANLGTTFAEEGKLEESVKAFETACQLDPKHDGFAKQRDQLKALLDSGGKLPHVDDRTVKRLCSGCHVFPEPRWLPRESWGPVIASMHDMRGGFEGADPRAVIQWFRLRSPKTLEVPERKAGVARKRIPSRALGLAPRPANGSPAVSSVTFADVLADKYQELFVSDMRNGKVLMALPFEKDPAMYVIASISHPAAITAVDFDKDKKKDLLVANLGSFAPEVHEKGGVYWLRQTAKKTFKTIPLVEKLGRVSDVKAGDFDNDGDLDLAIAEYGSRLTGRILVFEQLNSKKRNPRFKMHQLDARAGGVSLQLGDFDKDGTLDVAALIAEHHEMLNIYVNKGRFTFEEVNVHRAPHPSWGYTELAMVDIDKDGDQDFVACNGDGSDAGLEHGGLLQPFHGVQVFENQGQLQFKAHDHQQFRAAHTLAVADLDGDDDIDILSGAFQPFLPSEGRQALELDSVVWFEQTSPYQFERHSIEAFNTEHPRVGVGDFDLDGDVDFAVGHFSMPPIDPNNPDKVSIWDGAPGKNTGEWVKLYENLTQDALKKEQASPHQ